MKKIILLLLVTIAFSSCYTVVQVGRCKYYYLKPQFRSSYYKHNKPTGF